MGDWLGRNCDCVVFFGWGGGGVAELAGGGSGAVVVLYSTDLMLLSSVSGAAAMLGLGFRSVRAVSEVVVHVDVPGLILCVDLASSVDLAELSGVCGDAVLGRAIAFGPHVHVARLDAARACGFGQVVSRGQFALQLTQLLADRCGRGGSNLH